MDLNQKIQSLEKKLNALEVPAGAVASTSMITLPAWADKLTPWLEFGILVTGVLVGILTVIVYWQKAFGKKDDS